MIPVIEQPEPASFAENVRKKGLSHLVKKGIPLNQPLPAKADIEPYWRACLTDLHQAYGGICAYLCAYIERGLGAASVDHFVAKSAEASLAYEWKNYRLACSIMNSRKGVYDDVLDPFSLPGHLFRLELSTGHIYPDPGLNPELMKDAQATINRLALDDQQCRKVRTDWYQEYLEYELPSDYLKKKSPFVWYEANRQGLL